MTPIFPKYISDVQYIYQMSDIYIRCPISISDVRYLYGTFDIYIRRPIYNTRLRLGQGLGLGQGIGLGLGLLKPPVIQHGISKMADF